MKLQIEITRQDYVDFNKFHFLHSKLKNAIMSGLVAILIVELALNLKHFDLMGTILSSVFGILVYAYSIKRSLDKTKKIPHQDGTILGQKEFEFTDDGIHYKTMNSEGFNKWNSIQIMRESSKAIYLYMDSNMAIVIPKRFFKDADEMHEIKRILNRNINA